VAGRRAFIVASAFPDRMLTPQGHLLPARRTRSVELSPSRRSACCKGVSQPASIRGE
jgi:hypothetical protein